MVILSLFGQGTSSFPQSCSHPLPACPEVLITSGNLALFMKIIKPALKLAVLSIFHLPIRQFIRIIHSIGIMAVIMV